MTDQQRIQKCIDDSNWPTLLKVMYILVYWMMQKISGEECTAFCNQLGYEFNSTNSTISNGGDLYTIFEAFTVACNDIYPQKVALGPPLMKKIIKVAKDENYITPENYTELVAKL